MSPISDRPSRWAPAWLDRALGVAPPPATPLACRTPAAGQLWSARSSDGATRRLVLLIGDPQDVAAGVQAAGVLLVSDETDMAADTDAVLGREHDLPFSMLVHGDLTGPLPVARLEDCWGRAPAAVLRALTGAAGDRRGDLPGCGPPIRRAADPRWAFKLTELAQLRAVCGPLDWLD